MTAATRPRLLTMLAWHIGLRYLRRLRTARLAMAAITLTVAAPVAVTGVTQGLADALKRQAQANESDVTISSWVGMADDPLGRATLAAVPGVAGVAPYTENFSMMVPHQLGRAGGIPCLIDGIEWQADIQVGRLAPSVLHTAGVRSGVGRLPPSERGSGFLTPAWREQLCLLGMSVGADLGAEPARLPPRTPALAGVVAGCWLLSDSALSVGQQVELVGSRGSRWPVVISDVLGTGLLEVDKMVLLAPLPVGQALSGYAPTGEDLPRVDGYRIKAAPQVALPDLAERLADVSGEHADTWQERRRNEVLSLEYQRNLMVVVMLAIQAIAVFVVYAVFSTLVAEKRHDIGVLLGLGARRRDIAGAFVIAGLGACLLGGLAGWAIGWGLMGLASVMSSHFGIQFFPQDVYSGTDAPLSWDPRIPLGFISAMAAIGLVAITIPAIRAARIQPLRTLQGD